MAEAWEKFTGFMGEVWSEITSTEVPALENKNWGIGLFLCNIFLPGIGTFIAGLKAEKNTTMVVGLFQFLTAWFIVGWLWSIYWGWCASCPKP
ncbi:hypothetical protein T484DRAFT_1775811 [Baffinella frigidus]|nr:hypothetical protein T484DRAFT_1775811 [Cryptophyta sp. CCMP2293]